MKKLSKFKPNPDNPRTITEQEFETLKKNVKEFEKMLAIRPIVVDKTNMVIGGNSKYRALIALGFKEVPDEWITHANDLTEEERRRFIMLDNHHAGKDNWDVLLNHWDTQELVDWGIHIPDIDPPNTVNFNTAAAKGLRIKATCTTADQVTRITALLDEMQVEYKVR